MRLEDKVIPLLMEDGHRLLPVVYGPWPAAGMASAAAHDWRGDSYEDLARAHELPIPTIESR